MVFLIKFGTVALLLICIDQGWSFERKRGPIDIRGDTFLRVEGKTNNLP
jgi:hypothetical protein